MDKKRKRIEELITRTMKLLDSTGYNEKKYKKLFESMNDKEFNRYMKKFLESDDNFYLELQPFNTDTLNMDNIEKAARYLKVPLVEYVYMPYANPGGEPVKTQTPVPVGYVHMKRLEQILSKKNSFTTNIEKRSAKIGQVIADDKAGVVSNNDNFALMTIGAENALREFMGPRADDIIMKTEMMQRIDREGYVKLTDLPSDVKNKQAINTLDTYLIGAGLKTDLITPDLFLKQTLSKRKKRSRITHKYE